ncbi:response regulator [Pirellulales bacterium]|nr:response regulator [Pirellulales bacterium]
MTAPARVLIVDRSLDSREVLRTLLARSGAETFEASSPRRGLAAARQTRVDLIVLDGDDSSDDATENTRRLVAEAAGANTPIVVLGTVRRDALPEGAAMHVSKPYHYGQLLRKIESVLKHRA